jgi:hypothetical protein
VISRELRCDGPPGSGKKIPVMVKILKICDIFYKNQLTFEKIKVIMLFTVRIKFIDKGRHHDRIAW